MEKIIKVRVIPRASKNSVEKYADGFKVRLTAPATEGKANKALVALLADFFNLKKSRVQIINGLKSRDKLVRLITDK